MTDSELYRVNKTLAGIILFGAASIWLNYNSPTYSRSNNSRRIAPPTSEAVMPEEIRIRMSKTFQRRGTGKNPDGLRTVELYDDNNAMRYLAGE